MVAGKSELSRVTRAREARGTHRRAGRSPTHFREAAQITAATRCDAIHGGASPVAAGKAGTGCYIRAVPLLFDTFARGGVVAKG